MPTWVYAVVGIVLLVAVSVAWFRVRIRRIAASRPGENFDTFHSSFAADDIPAEILHAVYAEFQECCSGAVAAFPVRAEDNISRISGVEDEDLEDAVLKVIAELGRQLPPEVMLRKVQPVVIVTVRDFVLFVAACPVRRASLDAEFDDTTKLR